MGTIKALLRSRKAWLTMVGVALPVLYQKTGIVVDPEILVATIMAIVVLVGSIAYEDGKKRENPPPPPTTTIN